MVLLLSTARKSWTSTLADLRPSSLMRDYFSSLGDSAHPNSSDPRAKNITNFQELLLVAFREFSVITDDTILSERKKFRAGVTTTLESFSKRAAIRNLKFIGRFSKEQVGAIYDLLFKAIYEEPPRGTGVTGSVDATGRPETRISMNTFKRFLAFVASWARDEMVVSNGFQVSRCMWMKSEAASTNPLVLSSNGFNEML